MLLAISTASAAFTPLAASIFFPEKHFYLLFGKNLVELCDQNIKYLRVPTTVHQILQSGLFGSENTGTKTHAHVVIVHFVGLFSGNHVLLQKQY